MFNGENETWQLIVTVFAIIKPHCCAQNKTRPIVTDVAWSVCLCVFVWAVLKWLNRSRCCLGCGFLAPEELCIRWGVRIPTERGSFGHVCELVCGQYAQHYSHVAAVMRPVAANTAQRVQIYCSHPVLPVFMSLCCMLTVLVKKHSQKTRHSSSSRPSRRSLLLMMTRRVILMHVSALCVSIYPPPR